jgi:hypothetical protein
MCAISWAMIVQNFSILQLSAFSTFAIILTDTKVNFMHGLFNLLQLHSNLFHRLVFAKDQNESETAANAPAVSGEWSRFCVSSDKIALEKRTLANWCLQSGPNSLARLLGGWFIKF